MPSMLDDQIEGHGPAPRTLQLCTGPLKIRGGDHAQVAVLWALHEATARTWRALDRLEEGGSSDVRSRRRDDAARRQVWSSLGLDPELIQDILELYSRSRIIEALSALVKRELIRGRCDGLTYRYPVDHAAVAKALQSTAPCSWLAAATAAAWRHCSATAIYSARRRAVRENP